MIIKCSRCNTPLLKIDKDGVLEFIEKRDGEVFNIQIEIPLKHGEVYALRCYKKGCEGHRGYFNWPEHKIK